jgi:hypothetical protein
MVHSCIHRRTLQQVKSYGINIIETMARGRNVSAEFDVDEHDFAGSNEDEPVVGVGSWTDEEKRLFLLGLKKYGKGNWAQIAPLIKTR